MSGKEDMAMRYGWFVVVQLWTRRDVASYAII